MLFYVPLFGFLSVKLNLKWDLAVGEILKRKRGKSNAKNLTESLQFVLFQQVFRMQQQEFSTIPNGAPALQNLNKLFKQVNVKRKNAKNLCYYYYYYCRSKVHKFTMCS